MSKMCCLGLCRCKTPAKRTSQNLCKKTPERFLFCRSLQSFLRSFKPPKMHNKSFQPILATLGRLNSGVIPNRRNSFYSACLVQVPCCTKLHHTGVLLLCTKTQSIGLFRRLVFREEISTNPK